MKKWIKIGVYLIIGFFIALISFPLLFKTKVKTLLKTELSKTSGSEINFKDLDISLLRSFPQLSIRIDSLTIQGNQAFTKSDLFSSAKIYLDFDLIKVFKSKFESFELNKLIMDGPVLNIITSKNGSSNLDGLFSSNTDETDDKSTGPLSFDLKLTKITDGSFSYQDSSAGTYFDLLGLNHEGRLEYLLKRLIINQKSTFIQLDYTSGPLKYLSKVNGKIDGSMVYSLDSNRLELQKDSIILNKLRMDVDGFLVFNDINTLMDIHIQTPQNDLGRLISLIPGAYQHHFDQLTTRGSFLLDSKITGMYNSAGRMPLVSVAMKIKDGQIKYGHLPYPIDDLSLDYTFKTLDTSFNAYLIDVPEYHFRIEEDHLSGRLQVQTDPKNTSVKGKTVGKLNLMNLNKALPIDSLTMSGLLDLDATYAFDNALILSKKFDQLTLDGQVNGDALAIHYKPYNTVTIKKIGATLNPAKTNVRLDSLRYGSSDIHGEVQIINPLAALTDRDYLSQYIVSSRSNLLDINELTGPTVTNCDTCIHASTIKETDFALRANVVFDSYVQKLKYADYNISSLSASGSYKRDSLSLKDLHMNINGSYISAQGNLINPYRWSDQSAMLKGNIALQSKLFDTGPWITDDISTNLAKPDTIYIKNLPPLTDLGITANCDEVKYDGWLLKDVSFNGRMKDQAIEIEDAQSALFGGRIHVNGLYNELGVTPDFNLKLDLTKLRIEDMFKTSKVFATIAPVAAFLEGLFSTNIIMQGQLNINLDPVWSSFDAAGVLETVSSLFSKFKPLEEISKKIQLPLINYFKWERSKNWFEIEKGKISIKPFVIQNGDINLTVSGSQQIDHLMDYNLVLSIPRKTFDKYKVGLNANASLDWLRKQAAAKGISLTSLDTIFVAFNLQGTFDKPTYTLNLAENPAGKSLVDQVKENLANEIQNKADSLKEEVESKIQNSKDSLIGLIKNEANQQKEKLDSLAKVVEDSLKKIAEKQAKLIVDSIIKKEAGKVLDSATQAKIDTLLGKKAKSEIDIINEKLKNWKPFKKKGEKENQE